MTSGLGRLAMGVPHRAHRGDLVGKRLPVVALGDCGPDRLDLVDQHRLRRLAGPMVLVAQEIGQECLNLAGKTSLPVLGGVIARLSVLVTNDSGPAHIAYALGTPTATIFGGGNPETNGPPGNARHQVLAYEVPCRPCGLATCPIGYRCLEGVTVQQAVEAAMAVMR